MSHPHADHHATHAGLGLRRALMAELHAAADDACDFLELAPENWIGIGGPLGEQLQSLGRRFPLTCHGLSLSIGGTRPLDEAFLARLRRFLDQHHVALYSDHLSYCSDDGQLYDLLPIPFTDAAVHHVAARIRQVQDTLGRRIAVENISYYAAPFQHIGELEFIQRVLDDADCDLLLDVNNVYVNSINHGYDPDAFLDALPSQRVVGYHVAGHYDEADDLKIDTHGAPVKERVWALLQRAYQRHGVQPTLLERDFNIPPLAELQHEIERIRALQREFPSIGATPQQAAGA